MTVYIDEGICTGNATVKFPGENKSLYRWMTVIKKEKPNFVIECSTNSHDHTHCKPLLFAYYTADTLLSPLHDWTHSTLTIGL